MRLGQMQLSRQIVRLDRGGLQVMLDGLPQISLALQQTAQEIRPAKILGIQDQRIAITGLGGIDEVVGMVKPRQPSESVGPRRIRNCGG